MTLQHMYMVMGMDLHDIYVSAIGALHTDNDYVHGDAGVAAAAASISLPPRASGDLLVAFCSSPGSASNMFDTTGNWVTTSESSLGGGNQRQVYTKVSEGNSNDDYSIPAATGQFEQARNRMVQIICLKSRTGTPTFMEIHGSTPGGSTYDLEITERDVTVIETNQVLTLVSFFGDRELAGGTLSTDTPYGLTTDPSLIAMIGEHSYGYAQPNQRYVITGWGWEYMTTSTTRVIEDLQYRPGVATAMVAESDWMAFYST